MGEDLLVVARKQAERAVEGMAEGPLKIAAFQTILASLLSNSNPVAQNARSSSKATARPEGRPDTLTGRILAIASEGYFETQRSLGEVREALGSHGWHYPVTTLSGAMQSLVRQRNLRRERVTLRGRQVWKYSNS